MASWQLTETTINLILAYIEANIAAELALVRNDRPDASVSTEPPKTYFIYPRARGYRPPAVFAICEEFDFRLEQSKPNYINALAKVNVSILVEDRDRTALTVKCWRYQAALARMLDNLELSNQSGSVKLVCKEVRHSFSPLYTNTQDPEDPKAVFRKEVVVELEVEHYEEKV